MNEMIDLLIKGFNGLLVFAIAGVVIITIIALVFFVSLVIEKTFKWILSVFVFAVPSGEIGGIKNKWTQTEKRYAAGTYVGFWLVHEQSKYSPHPYSYQGWEKTMDGLGVEGRIYLYLSFRPEVEIVDLGWSEEISELIKSIFHDFVSNISAAGLQNRRSLLHDKYLDKVKEVCKKKGHEVSQLSFGDFSLAERSSG